MQPNQPRHWNNWIAGIGIVKVAFAVPHFVDDFLYGIPEEFGLTNPQAQVLGGLYFAAYMLAVVMAGRGIRASYYATCAFGLFLTAALILRHMEGILAAEPYWGGLVSEGSIIGLLVSSIALAAVSLAALRSSSGDENP